MRRFSPPVRQALAQLAQRHGFSEDAAMSMLESIMQGNGCTAQFSHPEFGGCGQWVRGGMTLLADMFDQGLKLRVAGLCRDLSELASAQAGMAGSNALQPRRQAQAQAQQQASLAEGRPRQIGASHSAPAQHGDKAADRAAASPAAPDRDDIFAKIERLAGLHARGFVSEAEFAAKKAELLARL